MAAALSSDTIPCYQETLTERLRIRPVTIDDTGSISTLFADQAVMEKFVTGKPRPVEATAKKVAEVWTRRFAEGDPFSLYVIENKSNRSFVGIIALGHGDEPGQAELSYVLEKSQWNQRMGTEAVQAVCKTLVPALKTAQYSVNGAPFNQVMATARIDNTASVKILDSVMQRMRTEEKYGHPRYCYALQLNDTSLTTTK